MMSYKTIPPSTQQFYHQKFAHVSFMTKNGINRILLDNLSICAIIDILHFVYTNVIKYNITE